MRVQTCFNSCMNLTCKFDHGVAMDNVPYTVGSPDISVSLAFAYLKNYFLVPTPKKCKTKTDRIWTGAFQKVVCRVCKA